MHAVAVGWYWSIVQILDIEKSRSWREAKIHTEDAHPRNSKYLRFFDQYTNISMETVARKKHISQEHVKQVSIPSFLGIVGDKKWCPFSD